MRKLNLAELNRVDVETFKLQEKTKIVVILDNIRSARNVGSFFRTSDAFGIEKILLCGVSATPPHKEITKTAIGATSAVQWEYYDNVEDGIRDLKNQNYEIISIEQTDESILLNDYSFNHKKVALIFGNEIAGVSDEALELTDLAIEIPQFGTKHSLNVAVCGGVILWEFKHKLALI